MSEQSSRESNLASARLWATQATPGGRFHADLVEARIREIWRDFLECDVRVVDDFFDIGGSSLLVVSMLRRIRDEFGTSVRLRDFFEHPTVEQLARMVRQTGTIAHSCLLSVNVDGPKRPFFRVYPGAGLQHLESLRAADPRRPFHHLLPIGYDDDQLPPATVEEMATHYIDEIRPLTDGPLVIGGDCGGALIAWEMAQQLAASGDDPELLLLTDPTSPGDDETDPREYFFFVDFEYLDSVGALLEILDARADEIASDRQTELLGELEPELGTILADLKTLGAVVSDMPFERFFGLVVAYATYIRALIRYDVRPYDGPLWMFPNRYTWTDAQRVIEDRMRVAWDGYALGPLEIATGSTPQNPYHDGTVSLAIVERLDLLS